MNMIDGYQIMAGDCREVLRLIKDGTVDSVVCDPPYELGFMGKGWDKTGIAYDAEMWKEVLRVLKPGGHLLAFGGTRTYHRMACAIEDAGFEIRDQIQWLYAKGFPKSRNVGRDIADSVGQERRDQPGDPYLGDWDGWGTALKPANEPICMARRPLAEGTVSANVRALGTGAINVDGCRIAYKSRDDFEGLQEGRKCDRTIREGPVAKGYGMKPEGLADTDQSPLGRWPANVVLSHHTECTCKGVKKVKNPSGSITGDEPSVPMGKTTYGKMLHRIAYRAKGDVDGMETIEDWDCHPDCPIRMLDDQMGGASRFFYCTKASGSEREYGLESVDHVADKRMTPMAGRGEPGLKCKICGKWKVSGSPCRCPEPEFEQIPFDTQDVKNVHPTVKPIELMRWLCRMVTPLNGTVLDPFCGSGSTGCAAVLERFRFIGVEKDAGYVRLAEARIKAFRESIRFGTPESFKASDIVSKGPERSPNQGELF